MENNNEELTALTNSLNYYNLEGYKIHEYFQQDKRIKIKLYFLTDEKGKSLTGHWRYIELNHFIHGLGTAKKIFCNSVNEYDKLKEQEEKDQETIKSLIKQLKNNIITCLYFKSIQLPSPGAKEIIISQLENNKELLSKIEK